MPNNNVVQVLEVVVDHLVFRNDLNGFTVAEIHYSRDSQYREATAVGYFPAIAAGEMVKMEGEFVYNSTYGKQFKVAKHWKVIPTDARRIEKLLGGGLFRGVGPVTAKRVVDKFGDDTMEALEKRSPKLLEVKGVGSATAKSIWEDLDAYTGRLDIIAWMTDYGFTNTMIGRITEWFRDSSVDRLKQDPYILTRIQGIGFPKADAFAHWVGVSDKDPKRIAAAMYHVMMNDEQGNTYLTKAQLRQETEGLLGMSIEDDLFESGLKTLRDEKGKVIETKHGVHMDYIFHAERYIAERTVQLVSDRRVQTPQQKEQLEVYNRAYERQVGVTLNKLQRRAVLRSVVEGASILTGAPGTGKTLTIGAIINAYQSLGQTFRLCAPTGRAAKRMTESFGHDATTIHRLLEWDPGRATKGVFLRNEDNPLATDLVIVDETSMVDVRLMESLMRAVPVDCSLVLVGDEHQLPSIGPGNILADVIASNRVPFTRLTELYRQAETSIIVKNAHRVNDGDINLDAGGRGKDFIWHPDVDPKMVVKTVAEFIPKYYGIDSGDVIVLSPIRKAAGELNVNNLNRLLQDRLNPGGLPVPTSKNALRVGDRVVHNENDYIKMVFNGDIGTITRVSPGSKVDQGFFYVDYYGREVSYDLKRADEVELARAISIHRSQGGEYEAVVVVLPDVWVARRLLSRNLLYTAVTRSRKLCILLGKQSVVHKSIRNSSSVRRNTLLEQDLYYFYRRLRRKQKGGIV